MSGVIAPATLDAPGEAEPEDSSSPDPELPAPAEPEDSPETTLAPESPDAADGERVDGIEGERVDGIGWEDLEDLTLEIAGEVVQLDGGSATISYGGASETVFTLQNRVVQGDLDGDGDEDFVAHIVEHSPGSGVFHLIVPVIDDAGRPVVGQTVGLGDRIVVDDITVKDGSIEVVIFDRAPDEPFTVITRRTTLDILLAPSAPLVRVVGIEPVAGLPLPGPEPADIEVRFDIGAVSATESGTIGFREGQAYTVQASAAQEFMVVLEAPIGVWLDVRFNDDQVLVPGSERTQQAHGVLPATGQLRVTVVSSNAGESSYELMIEVLPAGGSGAGEGGVGPGQGAGEGGGGPGQGAGEGGGGPGQGASDGGGGDETSTPTSSLPAVRVPRPVVPDRGRVMYLTFDDGPHPVYTPQVLDVLARHGAMATFFVIGRQAEAYPRLVDRIVAEGHTVANHTWNHESLAGLPKEAFDSTVGSTQSFLGSRGTPCLRPPFGTIDAFTQDWAAEHGLRLTLWTVDPGDWQRPSAEAIADHIVERARAGAVVLLHDGGGDRSQTVEGLDMALERLADSGLAYKTLCR